MSPATAKETAVAAVLFKPDGIFIIKDHFTPDSLWQEFSQTSRSAGASSDSSLAKLALTNLIGLLE